MSLPTSEYKELILCSTATRILGRMANTYIKLKELTPDVIVQKACLDLGVVSIARELETFLIQRSHGNPFYCEELLRNLHLNHVLQFYVLNEDEEKEDEWDNLFTTTALKPKGSKILEEHNALPYICTVKENVKLHNIMLPPSLKGIALSKIDNMNPSEQMVVKCAAVIGVTFSTHLLLHILPKWTKVKMNQTLAALVETHVFECFTEGKTRLTSQTMDIFTHELGNFPKTLVTAKQHSDLGLANATRIKQEEAVVHCKFMGFRTPLLQEAAYELWLKSQKNKLHLQCARYLESDAHRCKCCGKGNFVAFHHYTVDSMLWKTDMGKVKKELERDTLSEAASTIVSQTLLCLEGSHSHHEASWRLSHELLAHSSGNLHPPGSEGFSGNKVVRSISLADRSLDPESANAVAPSSFSHQYLLDVEDRTTKEQSSFDFLYKKYTPRSLAQIESSSESVAMFFAGISRRLLRRGTRNHSLFPKYAIRCQPLACCCKRNLQDNWLLPVLNHYGLECWQTAKTWGVLLGTQCLKSAK